MEIDKNELKLAKSKAHADGKKYFSLFEKHIPELGVNKIVYLYALGNIDCIYEIIEKNKEAKYFIYDSKHIVNVVKLLFEDVDVIKTEDIYNINDMKFDCIIMNPPYKADLHLKILAEAIKHLKDDSKCVNLSPVRWLQDVIAHKNIRSHFSKYTENVAKHLVSIDVISAKDAINLFNGGASADLGIYIADNNLHNVPDIKKHYGDFILNKVVYDTIDNDNVYNHCSKEVSTEYFVCIPESHGNAGCKDWCDIISSDKKYSRNKSRGTHASYVMFNNEESAENFRKSLSTDFMRFLNLYVKMNMSNRTNCYPWMGDAINPCTGLKGYESEWTDEDFYKFFDITLDEQKIIEDTMAKYK